MCDFGPYFGKARVPKLPEWVPEEMKTVPAESRGKLAAGIYDKMKKVPRSTKAQIKEKVPKDNEVLI